MIIISADFWFSIAYDQKKKKKKALKKYCEDDFNVRFAYLNFFFFCAGLCSILHPSTLTLSNHWSWMGMSCRITPSSSCHFAIA